MQWRLLLAKYASRGHAHSGAATMTSVATAIARQFSHLARSHNAFAFDRARRQSGVSARRSCGKQMPIDEPLFARKLLDERQPSPPKKTLTVERI